jgi:hypothetical protein
MNKLLRDSKNRDYQSGNQTQLNEERNSPFFMRLEGPLQFFQSRFVSFFSDSNVITSNSFRKKFKENHSVVMRYSNNEKAFLKSDIISGKNQFAKILFLI